VTPIEPESMVDTIKKHKGKIVNGSGIAALIGSLTVTGLQYQESSAMKEALFATQSALNVMGQRYENLVNTCLERIDDSDDSR